MEDQIVQTKGSAKFKEADAEYLLDQRRRIPGVPKKGFEPTQMWDVYQEIARRVFLGQKNVAIANDLNITSATVSYVRNSEMVQGKLNLMHAEANQGVVQIQNRIKEIAPKALDVLEALIAGKVGQETIPAALRGIHAEKLLDRAGYAPPKEIRSLHAHQYFDSDDLAEIKKRATKGAATIIVEEGDLQENEKTTEGV